MTDTTPKTPAEFVERMLRDGIESDLLAAEHVNDRDLREAHIHAAVAAWIAANAMNALAAQTAGTELAQHVADNIRAVIIAGELSGPLYRAAKSLGYDADQWIAEFNERAALRGAKPEAGRRAAHIALGDLAERWDRMAKSGPDFGDELLIDEPTPAQLQQHERAATYRKAASDIRDVLRTGRIPHDLMTEAELEQHGTTA
jgi:hypothetical protein